MLGYVEYPNNTLVNASYINEGDDILYQYSTGYFDTVPEGATVLVQNAGETPLQGCIGLFTDELQAQFEKYNTGIQGFEYTEDGLDVVMFANALTYKAHQTDEYTFISNFIFSRMLGDEAYQGQLEEDAVTPPTSGSAGNTGSTGTTGSAGTTTTTTTTTSQGKTGDTANLIVWTLVAIAGASVATATFVTYRRRQTSK
jgi:hypothetical protein